MKWRHSFGKALSFVRKCSHAGCFVGSGLDHPADLHFRTSSSREFQPGQTNVLRHAALKYTLQATSAVNYLCVCVRVCVLVCFRNDSFSTLRIEFTTVANGAARSWLSGRSHQFALTCTLRWCGRVRAKAPASARPHSTLRSRQRYMRDVGIERVLRASFHDIANKKMQIAVSPRISHVLFLFYFVFFVLSLKTAFLFYAVHFYGSVCQFRGICSTEASAKTFCDLSLRNARSLRRKVKRLVVCTSFTRRDCIIVAVVVVLALVAIVTTLVLGLPLINEKRARYSNITFRTSPSQLGEYRQAAVTVDGEPCAPIGKDILSKGGSAVDAAVALLFCNGAVNPQSMGLGGGVFITVYTNATGVAEVIDGREVAPASASAEKFVGNSSLLVSGKHCSVAFPIMSPTATKCFSLIGFLSYVAGPLSVAVPGELKAYGTAHEKYGKLPWSQLVQPTIDLCRNGFPVGKHLAEKLQEKQDSILNEPTLKEMFFNNETNAVFKEGEILKRPMLADTLEQIAQKGADELYSGELGTKFVQDVQNLGVPITSQDLKSYKALVKPATKYTLLGEDVLYSVPPPGSGPVLSLILGILAGYGYSGSNATLNVDDASLMYHRIVESFKFAYAKRTYLGDEDFVNITDIVEQMLSRDYANSLRSKISDLETREPSFYEPASQVVENKGTAHVNVLAPNGDAVSATSTVNRYGMDDFSVENSSNSFGLEWSAANLIAPGKRPLSSMCPTIVTDPAGSVHTVVGGAGGSRITSGTALASVLFRALFLDETIKRAIDDLRIHHQLYPNQVYYEKSFLRKKSLFPVLHPRPPEQAILDQLQQFGHKVTPEVEDSGFQGITRSADGSIFANMDYRKGGSIDGF
ncbi:hypothetical protein HPB48_023282 [Haemaphysalis longicornis]|uniref:Gamma-glutamyltransferase n=1 Tax=Haemaphysalis longicornis TaxID=44386 RepID=A0A9J6H4V5_HAELO|nr:hypothetical protein HPB48_023282 [Haemaphysalis longicornis]